AHVRDRCVGVADDVPGFVGGQPVVQRHGDGPDLSRGADRRHELRGVGAAPDDLLARANPERHQRVGEAVRALLQLAVGPADRLAAPPVVDPGRPAPLALPLTGPDVWHGRLLLRRARSRQAGAPWDQSPNRRNEPTSCTSAAAGGSSQRSAMPSWKRWNASLPDSGLLPSSASVTARWTNVSPSSSRKVAYRNP